jgi:hypothetical protein
MTDDRAITAAREQVAAAHDRITEGRFAEAVGAFEAALAVLAPALGETHPEVEELAADLDAARQMREVDAFGTELGDRHWDRSGRGR